jgi:hypothetical protein
VKGDLIKSKIFAGSGREHAAPSEATQPSGSLFGDDRAPASADEKVGIDSLGDSRQEVPIITKKSITRRLCVCFFLAIFLFSSNRHTD